MLQQVQSVRPSQSVLHLSSSDALQQWSARAVDCKWNLNAILHSLFGTSRSSQPKGLIRLDVAVGTAAYESESCFHRPPLQAIVLAGFRAEEYAMVSAPVF